VTKDELLDGIARERERLLTAIDALGDRANMLPVTEEGWTAKDALAHLIHWAVAVGYGLGAPVPPPVYMFEERKRREAAGIDSGMPSGEESNALAVAHYRDRSLADLRAEFEAVADMIVAAVQSRTDEALQATDAIPWAPKRPLWHFVAGDTVMHWPVHAAAIEQAKASE
jgi:hypothetical protein